MSVDRGVVHAVKRERLGTATGAACALYELFTYARYGFEGPAFIALDVRFLRLDDRQGNIRDENLSLTGFNSRVRSYYVTRLEMNQKTVL